jgi:hypothetical protein
MQDYSRDIQPLPAPEASLIRHQQHLNLPLLLFGALLALYVVLGLALPNAPLQDLPNHLTRARIMADLLFDHGSIFGRDFVLHLAPEPYLGGDLVLSALVQWTGAEWASRLWIAASLALLPLSACFASRKEGADKLAACTAGILAFYVSTDMFFLMGFTNFQLGMACSLFAYGYFRDAQANGRLASYLAFAALLLLGYLLHLAAPVLIIAIMSTMLGLAVIEGRETIRRALVLLLGPAILGVWQLVHSGLAVTEQSDWGGWLAKAIHLAFAARKFERVPDYLLFAALLGIIVVPLLRQRRRQERLIGRTDLLVVVVLLGLYLIMPLAAGRAYAVDARALPYALLFLMLASVRAASSTPRLRWPQLALASVLAVLNLGYVAAHLLPSNAAMGAYKSIAARVPRDSLVLPVDTESAQNPRTPFLHAGSFATLTTAAMTPYLFAGDQNPHIDYFQYVDRPYAPALLWYIDGDQGVPWARVLERYQYLLITAPWDPRRIPVRYTVVASNQAAALLKLQGAGDH